MLLEFPSPYREIDEDYPSPNMHSHKNRLRGVPMSPASTWLLNRCYGGGQHRDNADSGLKEYAGNSGADLSSIWTQHVDDNKYKLTLTASAIVRRVQTASQEARVASKPVRDHRRNAASPCS